MSSFGRGTSRQIEANRKSYSKLRRSEVELSDDTLEFFQIAFDAILSGAAGIGHGADDAIGAFRAACVFGIGDRDTLADGETKIGHG